ncbi:cytidine deaminase-like protein [Hypoxylon sp. FL1150]|nr:cytidine deaminase-like protein [Hypoxylon sp. FL1150]
MAGHKISGYAANLWKALFASFIQLFARIFHAKSSTTHKPQPSHAQTQTQSRSQSQPLTNTLNPDSPSLCASSASASKPASDQLLLDQPFLDIEQGLDSQDDTMAPKKRGQKRRGAKGTNEPKPVGPGTSSTGPSNGTDTTAGQSNSSAPPRRASQDSVSARATPIAKQGNTKVNSNSEQTNHQKPTASDKSGRNRGPQPSTDDRKENAAPTKTTPAVSQSQSPALKPLAAEHDQTQKTGTRSLPASKAPHSSGKPEMTENMPLSEQAMQHVSASVDRLSLDDVVPTQQPTELKSAVATTPAKLPMPVVVAMPYSDRIGTNSAKPTLLPASHLPGLFEPKTEEERIKREYHLQYMREALAMGASALSTNETPVGCVLVYHGKIIAKGMNATNITRNGTRHAEFMAISALLSQKDSCGAKHVNINPDLNHPCWGDVDPSDGHVYPYGQKLHPAPVVDRSILSECVLYVTVEPCVMCASLLRQLGIKKVYFGAVNDKFGGTGGVFKIHMNSKPVPKPEDRPYQNGYGPPNLAHVIKGRPTLVPREWEDGDGGNIEDGYAVEGGYLRDDAVSLLRRFYVQENGRAPQPRKKEGRAARLYANEQLKNTGSGSDLSDSGTFQDASPVNFEGPMGPTDDGEDTGVVNGVTATL